MNLEHAKEGTRVCLMTIWCKWDKKTHDVFVLPPTPQHAHEHTPIKCTGTSWLHCNEWPTSQTTKEANRYTVDEAHKKEATSAASHCAEEEHQAVLWQLKESEDAVEQEEGAVCKHTARPDLQYESLWYQPANVFHSRTCRSLRYQTPVDADRDSEAERDSW